jgi:hypothetical protein
VSHAVANGMTFETARNFAAYGSFSTTSICATAELARPVQRGRIVPATRQCVASANGCWQLTTEHPLLEESARSRRSAGNQSLWVKKSTSAGCCSSERWVRRGPTEWNDSRRFLSQGYSKPTDYHAAES